MKRILQIFLINLFISCVPLKNKEFLEDANNIYIENSKLKTDGYYYSESLFKPTSYFNTNEDIKMLHVFFINNDGFTYEEQGINGIVNYYCVKENKFENSFDNAHFNINQMVLVKNENKIKFCNFDNKKASSKGLTKIYQNDSIKIQIYTVYRNYNAMGFNANYLREYYGKILNDSTFVMKKTKNYYLNKEENINEIYHFRKSIKPNLKNYFKYKD